MDININYTVSKTHGPYYKYLVSCDLGSVNMGAQGQTEQEAVTSLENDLIRMCSILHNIEYDEININLNKDWECQKEQIQEN